jgi:nucleoid DNA-binding protein
MVNTIVGAVIDRLEQGHDVRLRGFGQFNIRESAVRNGRDFSTGALVPIASRPRVVFRASPGLVRDMTEALVGAVPAGEE